MPELVDTDATRRAELEGRLLITRWVREGVSGNEIARRLRIRRDNIHEIVREIRKELEDLGRTWEGTGR